MATHKRIILVDNESIPETVVELAEEMLVKIRAFDPPGIAVGASLPEDARTAYFEGYKSALSDLLVLDYVGFFSFTVERA